MSSITAAVPVAPRRRDYAAYGALGFPLAFAALPLYVHLPRFYVEHVGLSLAAMGMLLLVARLGDALIDPWLGVWSDWHAWRREGDRRPLLRQALIPFAVGMVMLLTPSPDAGYVWVIAALLLTYFGYSLVTINYYAWGAEIGTDPQQRVVVTSWREAAALLGVILAAALPALPAVAVGGPALAMQIVAAVFVAALVIAAAWTLLRAPPALAPHPDGFSISKQPGLAQRSRQAMRQVRILLQTDRRYGRLLAVLAISGFAASVPATLVMFFIADVLQLEAQQGYFLVAYFLAAAIGLPGWVALAHRIGKVRAWSLAMALAIFSFVWAFTLGPGDSVAFFVICVLTGTALGAEMALPPAILADLMARQVQHRQHGGLYFGIWNFVTKLNLALAAGVALPLLAVLGYQPEAGDPSAGTGAGNVMALAAVYSVIPAAVKAVAMFLVHAWRADLEATA